MDEPTHTHLKLLVVDDEPRLLSALQRALGRQYAVVTAAGGAAALAAAQTESFDAVICDIHMPGMSGPEFRRRLQERCPSLARHFIWMTGDFALASGPLHEERVLQKPFASADIEAALNTLPKAIPPEQVSPAAPSAAIEGSIQNHPAFPRFMEVAREADAVVLHLTVPINDPADFGAALEHGLGEVRGQAFRAKADLIRSSLIATWRWADALHKRQVLHVLGVGRKWTPSN